MKNVISITKLCNDLNKIFKEDNLFFNWSMPNNYYYKENEDLSYLILRVAKYEGYSSANEWSNVSQRQIFFGHINRVLDFTVLNDLFSKKDNITIKTLDDVDHFKDSICNKLETFIEIKPDIKEAIGIITTEMKNDTDYYMGWQANIAMAFKDEYDRNEKSYKNREDIHKIANQAAKNFLSILTK